MNKHTFLCRFVVVGGDDEGRVGPGFAGFSGKIDHGGRIVAARPRYHIGLQPFCHLNRKLDDVQAFGLAHGHTLARRAARYK